MIIDESDKSTIEKILSKLENTLPKKKKFTLQKYLNGREDGYSLHTNDRKVCWSEFRNTDQTVVYYGSINEFTNGPGWVNLPNEEVYQKKIFFDYRIVNEVVDFINQFLNSKGDK